MVPPIRIDEFARGQFDARRQKLAAQIESAHKEADADAVHDLRVSIRRFTQVLIVFGSCLPPKRVTAARRKLRRLMKASGDVRNLDVGLELIGPRTAPAIRKAFEAARWKAAARLVHRLNRAVDRAWAERWSMRMHLSEAPQAADRFAQDLLGPMEDAFRTEGDAASKPRTSAAALHRFRISCKRLRYTLELFEPLDAPRFTPRIEAVRLAQQILGEANDCAVTADMVAAFGGAPILERRLAARHRRLAASFRREWTKIRLGAAPAESGSPRKSPPRR